MIASLTTIMLCIDFKTQIFSRGCDRKKIMRWSPRASSSYGKKSENSHTSGQPRLLSQMTFKNVANNQLCKCDILNTYQRLAYVKESLNPSKYHVGTSTCLFETRSVQCFSSEGRTSKKGRMNGPLLNSSTF